MSLRLYSCLTLLCSLSALCRAQNVDVNHPVTLEQVRAKYDAPFLRNLQSFDCAIQFDWKQHFTETLRVGDEGTDEELRDIFQPIQNRVSVSRQSVKLSANLTEDAIEKLPYRGMAEGLLQHAVQKSLYTWLPASMNQILPDPATPVTFHPSSSGTTMDFKMQGTEVELALSPDLRLERVAAKADPSDHLEMNFAPGPRGFVLHSWTVNEDGDPSRGHRLIFTYTYQTVHGFQLPEQVTVTRESHHEVWRYKLVGCNAVTR